MLIVQKYGGSSVANKDRIMNVARRITDAYKKSNKIVVVVSAQGDTTDDLYDKAFEIDGNANKRELDMLVSTGEQQSAALLAIAIQKLGFPAISLNAPQVGIVSTSKHGGSRIKRIETNRILDELENNNIVIVAGFQGVNKYGNITTLGRGGSDTTAVALAAVLHSPLCEIYTDVAGVYTADPRIVHSSQKIDNISYDEMLELSALGANVLCNRAVEMAKKYRVNVVVRSSMSDEPGTLVKEDTDVEQMLITGIAGDKDVARISLVSVKDEPGIAFRVFSQLAREKICVDIILQSIGRNKTKDITFTVAKSDLKRATEVIEQNKSSLKYDHVSFDDNIAKLSVVGAGMASNPGVASMMFEALSDANINIQMISTSEIKISVLINEDQLERACRFVHDKFFPVDIKF